MSKKFFFVILVSVLFLGGAGCDNMKGGEQPSGENQNINQENGRANINAPSVETSGEVAEEPSEVSGVKLVSYVNKSRGYTISRPNGWYWQHLIQREIGEAMPGVEDLFVTDPNPLPRLGSEYLGRIVIEVSTRSSEELSANVSDLTSSAATVGGIEATKYEGERNNEMVQNQKVIAYHFKKDGKTYRIVYVKINSTDQDEEIFERLVESFHF